MKISPGLQSNLELFVEIVHVDRLYPVVVTPSAVRSTDDIDVKLFLLICKYGSEFAMLVALLRHDQITKKEFRRRRRLLFHKLAVQYSASQSIVHSRAPLDIKVFDDIIVHDLQREDLFHGFCNGELTEEEYLVQDNDLIPNLVLKYNEQIIRLQEAGDPINDKKPLLQQEGRILDRN